MKMIFDFNLMEEGWSKESHERYFRSRGIDVNKEIWELAPKFLVKDEGLFRTEYGQEVFTRLRYFRPLLITKELSEWM